MQNPKQVFQTNSKRRWRALQWTERMAIILLVLLVPVVLFTLSKEVLPNLPLLSTDGYQLKKISHPAQSKPFNSAEAKKYLGFNAFLSGLTSGKALHNAKASNQLVRAAFYVDWDPQSFYSLQKNIGKLNMVLPEWFFIDASADTLKPDIDPVALELMKSSNVKIVPMLSNVNAAQGEGEFDSKVLHRILHNKAKREKLIADLILCLSRNKLDGVNIDFEELNENSDEALVNFQHELYAKLHAAGMLVSQDIAPANDDFNVRRLASCNDLIFLMAYDEHYQSSVPGPVSGQRWIEKVLDETAADVPSEKIVLCLAAYGYDWPEGAEASPVTYQQALAVSKLYKTQPQFNSDDFNNSYRYIDASGLSHSVFFTDAATNFNTVRFADEYGTAGTALWRLGSEDDRLWTFYDRNLSNSAVKLHPFDYSHLKFVTAPIEKPDYIGSGEVLNVIATPEPGRIALDIDSTEGIITGQQYLQLPTKYVIRRHGVVKNQVVLTFDDGPDPEYTPEVLDILKKEKVPAAFFVVGMQSENNLPLLKRIYREGHEIGNHTFTHPNIAGVSVKRASAEIEATRLLIEAITGRSTILFRAPYNADAEPTQDAELRPVALSRQKNYYTVGESIDPNDWQAGTSADSIYERVVQQYEKDPSRGIILLHDAGGDRSATVEALPRIIHYFKSKGVQFATLSEVLHTPKNVIMPAVNSKLITIDTVVAEAGYYLRWILNAAFWAAIVLGLCRIVVMAAMAGLEKFREKKKRLHVPVIAAAALPRVSIIVPAYNEEVNAVKTVFNLLQQDYPNFDIVFVDDGSKDETYSRVSAAFMNNPRVQVLSKPNGGKASALNYGIAQTSSEYVICIDADTQLKQDAVSQLMRKFLSPPKGGKIGAVAGNVKVGNQRNLLTIWQGIEYTTAQNFDRRALDLVNGITVVPGAIGAFSKAAIEEAGGFTTDTLAEDCDLTIRILRKGYSVVNCIEAVAVTEAPETLSQFMKQRFRWCYGVMQSFWKNRDACFRKNYGALGMVSLPNILIFQIILPLLSPLADLLLILSLFWNRHDAAGMHKIEMYYIIFLLVDLLAAAVAFSFENEKLWRLIWLIPQRFVYRQLMYVVLLKAVRKAIKGEGQGWGVLKRTGNVQQLSPAIS